MENLIHIIESLLFVADAPLSVDALKKVFENVETRDIRQAIDDLMAKYRDQPGGFALYEIAGGYQFRTRPEYKEYIGRMLQPNPQRLSRAAMETLSIVAYHQPVLRSEVEHIRGVNSGNTLRILLERKLIRVLGRREIPGRPLVYGTSKKFLETFDLKDLRDLPAPDEIEAQNSPEAAQEASAQEDEADASDGAPSTAPDDENPENDGEEENENNP